MPINYNALSSFSVQGSRFRRINPDGTMPAVARTVGFGVTFDSDPLTLNAGNLTIKFDNGAEETKSVDFSAAVDTAAVTVAEAVTALTTAAFTDVAFTAEAGTGRLMANGTASGATYMMIYGEIAGYLDFGDTPAGSELGTKFLKYFDGTISVAEAKNTKEGEEIEQESGDGSLRTVITDDILKGENPVVTISQNDYELKELVMGGVYDATARTWTPPTTDDTEQKRFYIEGFTPLYIKGTSKFADKQGYEQKTWFSTVGMEADVSKEAKAWAPYAYNIKATEYTDENGAKQAAFLQAQLTLTEYDALDVENV